MNRQTILLTLVIAALLIGAAVLPAQQTRISPHETISAVVEKNRVTVVYGRPYSKDPKSGEIRKIWGTLVPYDKIWRVGADEATLFITQQTLMVGGTELPAGAYTLFMLPSADGPSKLVFNKQLGQWGLQYDQKQDFARVDLAKSDVDPQVDQFTMSVGANPSGGGVLKLIWEKTVFSLPYTLKK